MSVLLLFSALPETIFRVAATAIFLLAMVITILMTIASKKTMVFGWSENCRFRHRRPLGERTGKLQKPGTPSPDAGTAEMYIYTLSEKYLRFVSVGSVSALVGAGSVPVCGGALSTFLPLGPFACEKGGWRSASLPRTGGEVTPAWWRARLPRPWVAALLYIIRCKGPGPAGRQRCWSRWAGPPPLLM